MSGAVELEADLRAAVEHDERIGLKGAWLRNIKTLLDALATLRADNERLGRERDADIDALHGTFSKPIAVLQERVEAAEAERDTLLAQVEKMRGVLTEIAESDDIDNALDPERNKRLARAALTKEPS